jgi:hypothetical protein
LGFVRVGADVPGMGSAQTHLTMNPIGFSRLLERIYPDWM